MEVSPCFGNVLPEAWCKPGFMEAGYPGYRWRANLLIIEKSLDTYGPAKVARATSILDEDAYARYFLELEPEMWKFAHFTRYTSRPSAWKWALNKALAADHSEEARVVVDGCLVLEVQPHPSLSLSLFFLSSPFSFSFHTHFAFHSLSLPLSFAPILFFSSPQVSSTQHICRS